MKAFDLEFSDDHLHAIAEHGEREYPNEACGLVLGKPGVEALERVVPMKNVQDRYHTLDPERFPRSAKDAFRLDELERMKLLEASEGLVERVLYHSHCDAGAYFSPEDRANAVHQDIELMPGVVHVVVSVRSGRAVDMAAFRWDAEHKRFDEARLPLSAASGLPDLELRRMEGREAARPIKPVGAGLCLRRLTPAEAERLSSLAEGRRVGLSGDQLADLSCLGRGLFSPLTGFMRSADVFAVDFKGRLQSGTPWRTPLRLELPKKSVPPVGGGSVVELAASSGAALALMVVVSFEATRDKVFLGGPVYVYPAGGEGPDAAEIRAELVRAGAERVLAVPREKVAAARKIDLSAYDAFLCEEPLGGPTFPLEPSHRGPWMQAVIAQNMGATHILVEDDSVKKQIADTLEIAPL